MDLGQQKILEELQGIRIIARIIMMVACLLAAPALFFFANHMAK